MQTPMPVQKRTQVVQLTTLLKSQCRHSVLVVQEQASYMGTAARQQTSALSPASGPAFGPRALMTHSNNR